MTRRPTRASLLAAAAPSVRARNATPPVPAKLARRGIARPTPAPPLAGPPGALAGHVSVAIDGLRLVNPLNNRQHWRAVSERGRREKAAVAAALRGLTAPRPPLVATITRVSPGRLDDDGAAAAAKHVRDTVAAWLGIDDGDARVRYVVAQERGPAAVRIVVGPPQPVAVRVVLTPAHAAALARCGSVVVVGEGYAVEIVASV